MTKNYSSYKKTKEVYFGGDLAFPIAAALLAALITYGLFYFFGFTAGIIFNVVISWCVYFFMYYFGKSNTGITFDFLLGVACISGVLLFVDYGVYALVVYQKTGMFNKLYFQLWLCVLFGIPISYYAFRHGSYYLAEKSMATEYLRVPLKIRHDRELLMYIDNIQFVNASRRTMSDIKLEKPNCFYSESELNKMDSSNRNYYLVESIYNEMIHMPFGADSLLMSWYSVIEDKYYDIELPFPFEKLTIEQEKYPTNVSKVLRGKKTKRLNLHIHANGGIRLFNDDMVLIDLEENIPTVISEEVRNEKIDLHRQSHDYYSNPKAFLNLIEKIKTSGGIEERFLIQNKLIPWRMTISGLRGNNYLDVDDVSFSEYKNEIAEMEIDKLRFLPKKIGIVYRGNYLYDWLTLIINSQKLFQSIQKLTDGNDEVAVRFDLNFENGDETDLQFRIIANDKSILFNDWEIQVKKDRKQDMVDHLLDSDEDQQKRSLYKEAWDLVFDKQYDQAQEKCDMIKAIDPRYGFAYFLEVRLLWYKEGSKACYAKKDYFIAKTQHEPAALAHMHNNYGCLYDQESRYEESLTEFEKAIANNPKEGIYTCNLAEIYCKLNNPKKALEAAEKSKKAGHQSTILNALLESKGTRYV